MRHGQWLFQTGRPARAVLAALALLAAMPVPAQQADGAAADDAAKARIVGQVVGQVVDFAFVKDQVVFPAKPDVTIVDSRAANGGYDAAHVPGAISIPDGDFDRLAGLLPQDRRHLLIFYCEDAQRESSRQSALKAEQRGYINSRVYAAGLADWLKNGGPLSVAATYLDKLKRDAMPHTLIDARPARTAAKGMLPGAINVPDTEFDKHVGKLPADKGALLIYYCGGIDCPQSANSAEKARNLGYTNVRTYPEGYPEWVRLHQPGAPAMPAGN
jgi:rhodanese-related sulfurtransferase